MASAKQIEAWVREALHLGPRRVVKVRIRKQSVAILVNRKTHVIASADIGFAHVAQALLELGPACAEEGAQGQD